MNCHSFLFFFRLAGCLVVMAPAFVAAQEPAAQSGPPPWRIIGANEQTTSSRCIGRAETPLCAVETLLACFEWSRPDLCRLVDADSDQYAGVFGDPADPTKYLAYRVVSEKSTPDDDVEIVIEQQEMRAGQNVGAAIGTSSSGFKLHRQPDGRWKVTGWGDANSE